MKLSHEQSTLDSILSLLGIAPISVYEIVGQGEVNHVFVVEAPDAKWVVRFHRDPRDTDDYSKEEWCLRTAKAHGIPVPEFVSRGDVDGVQFIVQEFVEGVDGDERRSPDLWTTLGKYARTIHEIPLGQDAPDSLFPRFGRDLRSNWTRHIEYNLGELTTDDPLLALGAYDLGSQPRLRAIFQGLREKVTEFAFSHGDLVPKNTLVEPSGRLIVLDWGSASTGPIPFEDYARIRRDEAQEGFTDSDLQHFAEGYGTPVELILKTMHNIDLLNKVDVVRWAIDKRPDLIDYHVARCRTEIQKRKT